MRTTAVALLSALLLGCAFLPNRAFAHDSAYHNASPEKIKEIAEALKQGEPPKGTAAWYHWHHLMHIGSELKHKHHHHGGDSSGSVSAASEVSANVVTRAEVGATSDPAGDSHGDNPYANPYLQPDADGSSGEALDQCPESPIELCDFYFEGHPEDVPVFELSNLPPDAAISTPLVSVRIQQHVEVDQSGDISFLCPVNGSGGVPAGGERQFYLSGGKAQLHVRNFQQQTPLSAFENRCVRLAILHSQIPVGGTVINVAPGDSFHEDYPESRRCVIFRTGPNPPAPGTCGPIPLAPPPPPPPCQVPSQPPPPSPPPPELSPPPPSPPPPSLPPPPPKYSPPSPPPPPPPSRPGQECKTYCDDDPLTHCDFYFDGYPEQVPVIHLANTNLDQPISPGLKSPYASFPHDVEVDESGKVEFKSCIDQDFYNTRFYRHFYMHGQVGQLYRRHFLDNDLELLDGKCVRMELRSVMFLTKNSTMAQNLNPGEPGLEQWPELRRCVMFRTAM